MPPLPDPAALLQCRACPRITAQLDRLRAEHPGWHNRPVPAWGPGEAPLLVLGLAPGRAGANRTGRPFAGDPSGDWVQRALRERGRLTDGEPQGVRITNALKCLPPGNRPRAGELRACRPWLTDELAAGAPVVLALGRVAHTAALDALGVARKAAAFSHGARHAVIDDRGCTRIVYDSFHPSPLNTRTGRLSWGDFAAVVDAALAEAGRRRPGGALTASPAV